MQYIFKLLILDVTPHIIHPKSWNIRFIEVSYEAGLSIPGKPGRKRKYGYGFCFSYCTVCSIAILSKK